MNDLDQNKRYMKAKEKVEAVKSFYSSLFSYVVFISLLGALNYYIDGWNYPWFLWAALGWGIGLFFKGIKAFRFNPFFNKDWEERKIKEFMNEDSNKRRWE
ncbi:2TM domain-containing protein [Ascidiimonas sp. W6]|uniref:2TM domain-containing protein n=1 Tax=Ascidiimonas meishanensis TaxID=3128903 RepID=UPI0030EDFADE